MPEQHPRLLADRYELRTRVGRGTMGTVWRAYDRSLGREIAIKEIRQDPSLSQRQRQELRERMMREGRMAARVSHPSVATIHDVIVYDGIPWIIMELVEGRSLEQVIDEEGPLPPRLVAEIGYDLLGALRAAHAQNILHRDVKPANVLLTETGRVVLTDFGIAKALGDHALTQTGMVIGSPGYTAPERARGEYTGPESDLWSLGATLYFAVEGRPAYERATVSETLAALMTEKADPPTQAGPLRPVLDGLLEKDHTARLAPERAAMMLRMIADTPTGAIPPVPAADADAHPGVTGPASQAAGTAGGNVGGATGGSAVGATGGAAGRATGGTTGGNMGGVTGGTSGGGTGADEDDANRTMIVPRPQPGLRLPPPAGAPGAGAQPGPHTGSAALDGTAAPSGTARPVVDNGPGQTHNGMPPGQGPVEPLAPRPAFAGNGPVPPPGPPGGMPPAHSGTPRPPGAGYAGPPAANPVAPPGPYAPMGPAGGVPRTPSLGTDLFSMQGPAGPDAKTRVRVLVTMGVVLVAVLALILLGIMIFAK